MLDVLTPGLCLLSKPVAPGGFYLSPAWGEGNRIAKIVQKITCSGCER